MGAAQLHALRNTGAGMVTFPVYLVEQMQHDADGRRVWVVAHRALRQSEANAERLRLKQSEAFPVRVRPVVATLGAGEAS